MSQRLCYPYGAGISCTCDGRKRILRCVPVVDSLQSARGAGGTQEDYEDSELGAFDPEESLAKHGDERTEIILAATFLLIVILSFIAFIIHRCERNLYQRKHLQCLGQGGPGEESVKKSLSTVSIQTVPVMATFNNGEISTISRAVNGGTRINQDLHIGMEPVVQPQQYYYRPPSIISHDQRSPDTPPTQAPTQDSQDLQDPHQYRLHCEDIIESALARDNMDEFRDRTKM